MELMEITDQMDVIYLLLELLRMSDQTIPLLMPNRRLLTQLRKILTASLYFQPVVTTIV
jgi:hypothetical protein